jgi:hypothetical protein
VAGGELSPDHFAAELEHGREDERAERDERRGIEARASALLAAGAAVVGLVATAFRDLNVEGAERDRLLVLIAVASFVMVIALVLAARALSLGLTTGGHGAEEIRRRHTEEDVQAQFDYVGKIRNNNKRMLKALRPAAWFFAASVTLFLANIIWAGWASAPPPKTPVVMKNTTITVKEPPEPATSPAPRDCVAYLIRLDELVDDNPQLIGFLYEHALKSDAGAKNCGLNSAMHARALIRELALR